MARAVLATYGHQRAVRGVRGQEGVDDPGGQADHDGGDEDVGRADLADLPAELDLDVDAQEAGGGPDDQGGGRGHGDDAGGPLG